MNLASKRFNLKNYLKRAICCKFKYGKEFNYLEEFYKKLLDIKNYSHILKTVYPCQPQPPSLLCFSTFTFSKQFTT